MNKLRFGKKGGDAGNSTNDDGNRSALFGSRSSKSKSPAPPANPNSNPYAAVNSNSAPDPYSDGNKYAQQPQQLQPGRQPPAYDGGMSDFRREKSPVPPGGYGGGGGPPAPSGYGAPAAQGGYSGQGYGGGGGGGDRYGSAGPNGGPGGAPTARRGPGGYGGLGRSNSQETMSTDAGRDALFGNAPTRVRQQQQTQMGPPSSGPGGGFGAQDGYEAGSGAGDGGQGQGYGAYGDRQLTAEEEEEEDAQATKQQIRFMKQQDVSSTRNALRLAAQAEETGASTLARLGAQGERIHNTERNLDLAANQNRAAQEKARELKTANKSMFAMHVGNPFTASSRREARDQSIMDRHHEEREAREKTREAAFESSARQADFQRGMKPGAGAGGGGKSSLAERAKYQFEADSEDEDMENEIDSNLDALHGAAGRLNQLGRAMGREADEQNKHIDRITNKVRSFFSFFFSFHPFKFSRVMILGHHVL